MAFILSRDIGTIDTADDLERQRGKWEEYRSYLQSVRKTIPASAFEFATASWRHAEDHRSLHDSWVESLTISEVSSGERHEHRSLNIQVRLLGSYHDGYINLEYHRVRSYLLDTPAGFRLPPLNVGHGDWLCDEVRVSEAGSILHEVEFSRGSRWLIECEDITWSWDSLTDSGGRDPG